jgi:predicted HicB family RNase H-like nuclease
MSNEGDVAARQRGDMRVPKSLHAALASESEAGGVSLNQLVAAKLALHLQVR